MEHPILEPTPWMIIPFGLLLMSVALAPLFFAEYWHKHYPKVAGGLAAITIAYYLFFLKTPEPVLHVAAEYVSFIALIGSLFVVAGGIHISVKGEATPVANVGFLFVGAILANVLGTTGASMLLIRPWIRMNKYRVTGHHIVFFIFIVSNVGGCLTPIGDPPLFLGYLKGIPFWWVLEHCWPIWLTAVAILLAIFYVVDLRNYRKAPRSVREELAESADQWRFDGLHNVLFLAIILGAVFINKPRFLREGLMIAAAIGSFLLTKKELHRSNDFNFGPIKEVAILFVGIFATMLPALHWLENHAKDLGMTTPGFFYWGCGILSSVLDNAPTYYSFLAAIVGVFGDGNLSENAQIIQILAQDKLNYFIVAISVGAVFFGANTYIGNGPNFMVKAIADQAKVHTPGFIGYIVCYTLPYMVPMLVIIWLLFFH